MWLHNQKNKLNDINNDIYIELSENIYVKKSLDEYLENKELNKDKEKLNYEQWKDLLFEFCNINKKVPINRKQYKNNNIGQWLHAQKKKINDTNNDICMELSENIYVKKSLDEYLENKELNKDKEKFTWEQSKDLLFEFCNINKRVPKNKEQYKNNNIDMWLKHQKEKINDKNNNIYIKLSENTYVKNLLENYLCKKIV
jgi:2C-methyl-D-erythritol 2,4-cyclodiphosphate synthase